MAKIKTFASGQPLPASDVNAILNPEVPPGATTVATKWIRDDAAITPGTGWGSPLLYHCRVGLLQYIYIQMIATATHTVNIATGSMTNSQLGVITKTDLLPDGPDIGYGLSGGNSRIANPFITVSGAVGASANGSADIAAGVSCRVYGFYPKGFVL